MAEQAEWAERRNGTEGRNGGTAEWRNGGTAEWRNGRTAEGRKGGRAEGRKGGRAEGRKGGRAEGRKGRRAEGWKKGRMAEWRNGGRAEWQYGYIPNLPDIFTIHTDNDDTNTLIFYSIDRCGSLSGNSFSNHSMVLVLYLTSIPVLVNKSAPNITSYLQ
jgi:hypothetical protein